MIIGYSICGHDNDSYLNSELYEKNISECLFYIRNREKYIDLNFKIKKTKFDFSYTYDSALIVSQKFKDFCIKYNFPNIVFFQLKTQQDFYLFKVNNIIEFDHKRRGTNFLEFNIDCNEFNEVVGSNPVCLKDNISIENGFYRTDLEFGRGYAKSPLIIVGLDTYELIKKENFKGLVVEKILDRYDWEK